MKTDCGIYQLVHKRTKKIYIGSSIHLSMRKMNHLNNIKNGSGSSDKTMRAFKNKKPGEFHFGVIEYLAQDTPLKVLRRLEKEWCLLIPYDLSLNSHWKQLR